MRPQRLSFRPCWIVNKEQSVFISNAREFHNAWAPTEKTLFLTAILVTYLNGDTTNKAPSDDLRERIGLYKVDTDWKKMVSQICWSQAP